MSAANQGHIQQAIKDYKKAQSLLRQTFFGLPGEDLFRYWGETLVREGETDKGLEKLALAGLFGADKEAAALARKTFLEKGKSEDQYDDYLWSIRTKHGVSMVDFQAGDYKGGAHSFNQLKGKKATLLAFWFPT